MLRRRRGGAPSSAPPRPALLVVLLSAALLLLSMAARVDAATTDWWVDESMARMSGGNEKRHPCRAHPDKHPATRTHACSPLTSHAPCRPFSPLAPTTPRTDVSNCLALAQAFTTISNGMSNLQKGKNTYIINLSCDAAASADYSDCPAGSMFPDWSSNTAMVAASVTIQGAKGCVGAKRPVLSGGSSERDHLFYFSESFTQNTKVDLKLINLVLNGLNKRRGVYIVSPRGYISYTQTNVDVVNCFLPGYSSEGMGVRLDGVGRTIIKGGMFYNNGAVVTCYSGGALLWRPGDGTAVKSSLAVTGVNFTANSADFGGAVYLDRLAGSVSRVWGCRLCLIACVRVCACGWCVVFPLKPYPPPCWYLQPPAKVNLKGCTFDGNAASANFGLRGSAIYLSTRTATPPTKFTLALPGSTFRGAWVAGIKFGFACLSSRSMRFGQPPHKRCVLAPDRRLHYHIRPCRLRNLRSGRRRGGIGHPPHRDTRYRCGPHPAQR
jgi:hypothetical protein